MELEIKTAKYRTTFSLEELEYLTAYLNNLPAGTRPPIHIAIYNRLELLRFKAGANITRPAYEAARLSAKSEGSLQIATLRLTRELAYEKYSNTPEACTEDEKLQALLHAYHSGLMTEQEVEQFESTYLV